MRIYEKTLRYVTDPSPPGAAGLPVPLSESRRDGSCPCSAIGLRFAFARPCPGERLRRGTAAPGTSDRKRSTGARLRPGISCPAKASIQSISIDSWRAKALKIRILLTCIDSFSIFTVRIGRT